MEANETTEKKDEKKAKEEQDNKLANHAKEKQLSDLDRWTEV